jgi:uncharacterized protein YegP (UPF0339 family)
VIEIYRDNENNWHWRLVGSGKAKPVIAHSQGTFPKRSGLLKSLERVRETMPTAGIIEAVDLPVKADTAVTDKGAE